MEFKVEVLCLEDLAEYLNFVQQYAFEFSHTIYYMKNIETRVFVQLLFYELRTFNGP